MKTLKAAAVLALLVTLTAGVLAQNPPAQAPVFKSKVDVVQLDVSVLDKERQPVRGLTKADFVILEDGKPQPIVGFSTFDIDKTAQPATGWMRDIQPDVATNEYKDSRLFVIVMDDALIPQDGFAIKSSKQIAASIIDKLLPDDLTAIVFTGDNRRTQDFTNDKNKLRAALDKFNPGLAGYRFNSDAPPLTQKPAEPLPDTDLGFYQSSARTLENVAKFLSDVPNRRKAVFWVSPGVPLDMRGAVAVDRVGQPLTGGVFWDAGEQIWARKLPPGEMVDLSQTTERLFQSAQRASVTIYPIDPTGLDGTRNFLAMRLGQTNLGLASYKSELQQDYLSVAAANTGGRAVMKTNDFEPGIKDVFAENESYYLVTFEPLNTTADGKLRRLEVKVNRPDVEVRTRSGYYAPVPPKPDKKPDQRALSPEDAALEKSLAGILPLASLPLRAAVAPFALPGQRLSTVTIVLGITQPIPESAATGRITERTDTLTSAFTPDGTPKGTQKHSATITFAEGATGLTAYEALARIDLPPGRYSLRVAAHYSTSKHDASVFTDVIVPDYSNIPFSASPIVLGATPGRLSAPKDLLKHVLPFAPTAERDFDLADTDEVKAFLRLYQSGQKAIDRVQLSMQVRDALGKVQATETRTIGGDRFVGVEQPATVPAQAGSGTTRGGGASIVAQPKGLPTAPPAASTVSTRSADIHYDIPIHKLAPGPHLFTVEATLGTTTIRRDVRFVVR
jgi:VWFA-related protein